MQVVIIDVSAGSMHTAAVAASGELYTWGCNKSGQLGYDGRGQVEGYPRIAHMLFHRSGKAPRKATQVRQTPGHTLSPMFRHIICVRSCFLLTLPLPLSLVPDFLQVSAGASCTLVIVAPSAWMPGLPGSEAPKVYQFGYGSYMPVRVDFRPAERARKEGGRKDGLGGALSSSSSAGHKGSSGIYHHAGGGARIHIVKVKRRLEWCTWMRRQQNDHQISHTLQVPPGAFSPPGLSASGGRGAAPQRGPVQGRGGVHVGARGRPAGPRDTRTPRLHPTGTTPRPHSSTHMHLTPLM